jgi:hypothetical protein
MFEGKICSPFGAFTNMFFLWANWFSGEAHLSRGIRCWWFATIFVYL